MSKPAKLIGYALRQAGVPCAELIGRILVMGKSNTPSPSGVTIMWDGNTAGSAHTVWRHSTYDFYKVSDHVFAEAEMVGGVLMIKDDDGAEFNHSFSGTSSFTATDGEGVALEVYGDGLAAVPLVVSGKAGTYKLGSHWNGTAFVPDYYTLPEDGTYFYSSLGDSSGTGLAVASITLPNAG